MNTTTKLAEPKNRMATIQELLTAPENKARLGAVAPKHLTAERLVRTMALAVAKTPQLAECSWPSLLGAMMLFASLGLEPNTPLGHAYLIPFKKRKKNDEGQWVDAYEVNPIIGYRGFIELAFRSRMMVGLHADVVYQGDDFDYHYGSGMELVHRPKGVREGKKALHAYAFAKLVDGEAFEVLPYEEVMRLRNSAQAYQQALRDLEASKGTGRDAERAKVRYESSPWIKYEHEMASKTMIRRLSKMLPMSIEFARAVAADQLNEEGMLDITAFQEPGSAALADPEFAQRQLEGNKEEPIKTTTDDKPKEEKEPAAGKKAAEPKKAKAEPKQPDHDPETGEIDGGKQADDYDDAFNT